MRQSGNMIMLGGAGGIRKMMAVIQWKYGRKYKENGIILQVYEIVSEFLIERGIAGYWLLSEDEEPGKVVIWEHWRTGVKGKIVVYLDTGDCYEEAPYAGGIIHIQTSP